MAKTLWNMAGITTKGMLLAAVAMCLCGMPVAADVAADAPVATADVVIDDAVTGAPVAGASAEATSTTTEEDDPLDMADAPAAPDPVSEVPCNCEGCPCCESGVGGDPYCVTGDLGAENVCLNMDLEGNVGVLTCHACGVLASSIASLGHPCCVSMADGAPFCMGENTQCAAYAEGDVGFSEGIKGECECVDIASVTDDGECVATCGQCEGCECCDGVDGSDIPFCTENPLGDLMTCIKGSSVLTEAPDQCYTCGYAPGQPCCGQDKEGVEPSCEDSSLECVFEVDDFICLCKEGEDCPDRVFIRGGDAVSPSPCEADPACTGTITATSSSGGSSTVTTSGTSTSTSTASVSTGTSTTTDVYTGVTVATDTDTDTTDGTDAVSGGAGTSAGTGAVSTGVATSTSTGMATGTSTDTEDEEEEDDDDDTVPLGDSVDSFNGMDVGDVPTVPGALDDGDVGGYGEGAYGEYGELES